MVAAWLLALVIVRRVLARAGPVPVSKPTVAGMGCPRGRFPSLLPRKRRASSEPRVPWKSPSRWRRGAAALAPSLGPRTGGSCICGAPCGPGAGLVLKLQALGAVAHSSLAVVLDQHVPRHVCPELQACILARPRAGLPPWGCLHHWRHLQETVRWGPKAASRPLSRSTPSTSL